MNRDLLQQKNLIMNFIELATAEKEIKNEAQEKKQELYGLIFDLSKDLPKELYFKIENTLLNFETLVKEKYFNYGLIARTVIEEYDSYYQATEHCL